MIQAQIISTSSTQVNFKLTLATNVTAFKRFIALSNILKFMSQKQQKVNTPKVLNGSAEEPKPKQNITLWYQYEG